MQLAGTDFTILRVFDAVVRHGGFSVAQAELNISQSTISNHITALENRLGVKLCQRGRSGFRLTEKGEMVYIATQRLLSSLDDFSSEVGALKGQLVGKLKIGLVDCIATDPNSKLPDAISIFKKRPQNNVVLQITQESPQMLQEKTLNGDIHLGIGSFPHKISGLVYEPLYSETHSLYCGKGHHLFGTVNSGLSVRSLRNEMVVSRGYWPDQFQKDLGFQDVSAVVFEIEPQLILIISGQFIGFLPDHFAGRWVDEGTLFRLPLDDISYVCTFDLVIKKGYRKTQVLDTFLGELRSIYQCNV